MASEDIVLWNARVVDGRNALPQDRKCICVRDGKIEKIREAHESTVPDGALDLNGRFVMPGLIDAHIHLLDDPAMLGALAAPKPLKRRGAARPRARLLHPRQRRTSLLALRDHNDPRRRVPRRQRHRASRGNSAGPDRRARVLSCGRIISATAPGGRLFHSMYEEADGPWEMRRCVRNQLRRGADYIKVMAGGARSVLRENPEPAQLTKAEMDAVVDEAHRLGLRVAAHAEGLGAVRLAVEAGVDTVEHGLSLHRAPELLEQMARCGTVLVPTLSTFHDVGERFGEHWEPSLVQQAKRQQDEAHLTLIAAREAGVTLAMGFDSGPPGADALELVRMVEGRLTPHEGIIAATIGSARALGLSDVGTIEIGRIADLVVLNGDPLKDVTRLTRAEEFWMVVRDGRVVAGQVLENGGLKR